MAFVFPGSSVFLNSGSDLFGSKPIVPPWHSLDLGQEQLDAIRNNIAAFPEAAKLANMSEQQILAMMGQAIPGFEGMRTQAASNISDELAGKIPKDVQDQIQNSAAAKALGGGFGGSGMHSDLVARDLGLTSLSLMDKGLSSAENWMASTERMLSPAIAEFSNMFVSTGQQASFDVEERDKAWADQWLKNQITAMPDPVAAGELNTEMGLLASARGSSPPNQYQSPTPSTSPVANDQGSYGGNDWAKGWESANMVGYEGVATSPGVQGGYDWSPTDAAYAGAVA